MFLSYLYPPWWYRWSRALKLSESSNNGSLTIHSLQSCFLPFCMVYLFLWLLEIATIYEFTIFDFFKWNVPWTFMMFLDVHSKFGSPGFFGVSNRTSENENIEFMKSLKMGAVLGQLFKVMTRSSTASHRTSHSPFWPLFSFPILKKIWAGFYIKMR